MASTSPRIQRVTNADVVVLEIGIIDGLFKKLIEAIPGLERYVGIKTIIVDNYDGAFIVGTKIVDNE